MLCNNMFLVCIILERKFDIIFPFLVIYVHTCLATEVLYTRTENKADLFKLMYVFNVMYL